MNGSEIEVFRLADNLIDIDGLKVYNPKNDLNWYACNQTRIGTYRLQALYLFLNDEENIFINKFNNYVDEVLNELIYN